jgi:hypothetical protein
MGRARADRDAEILPSEEDWRRAAAYFEVVGKTYTMNGVIQILLQARNAEIPIFLLKRFGGILEQGGQGQRWRLGYERVVPFLNGILPYCLGGTQKVISALVPQIETMNAVRETRMADAVADGDRVDSLTIPASFAEDAIDGRPILLEAVPEQGEQAFRGPSDLIEAFADSAVIAGFSIRRAGGLLYVRRS